MLEKYCETHRHFKRRTHADTWVRLTYGKWDYYLGLDINDD